MLDGWSRALAEPDLSPGAVLGGVAAVLGGVAAVITARATGRRAKVAADAEAATAPGADLPDDAPELPPAVAALMGAFQQQITDLRTLTDSLQQKVSACEARDRRNVAELARLKERDRLRREAIASLRQEVARLRRAG